LLILLLALVEPGTSFETGRVRIIDAPAAVTILVDGQVVGKTKPAEHTFIIGALQAGRHTIVVRSDEYGDSDSYFVDVRLAEITTLRLSPLLFVGRSQLQGSMGDIRISTSTPPCSITIAGTKYEIRSGPLTARNIPTGQHVLQAKCGSETVHGEINVRRGRVTVIAIDLDRHTMNVTGDEPRTRVVAAVQGAQAAVMAAGIPSEWKRAISSAIDSNVRNGSVARSTVRSVKLTLECTSGSAASRVVEKLNQREEVDKVTVRSVEEIRAGTRIVLEVVFNVP
jgi:hypothetical protein